MPRLSRLLAALILLTVAIPTSAHAAAPQDATVSCESSWPVAGPYPVLQQRTLPGGKIEYYGRYKMWSPIDNELECHIRQLVFNIGRLANDLPQETSNGPALTFVVQHGIFHFPAKDMKIDHISIQPNGADFVEYTVDAQAVKGKRGIYYAKISVIGFPSK
jgi:hypothetical protein